MLIYVYIAIIILIIILSKRNGIGLIFIGILLILIATFRGLNVGSDTYSYYEAFNHITQELGQSRQYSGTQIIWYYINYVFYELLNFRLLLLFCSSLSIGCIFYVFKKYSPYPIISVLLFVLLFFYCSSLNIMRQYIAIGFILVSYNMYYKKLYKYWFILILLAASFHFSAIIGILIILITKLNLKKHILILGSCILSFIIGYVYIDVLKDYIIQLSFGDNDIMGYDQYFQYFGFQRNLSGNLLKNGLFLLTYYYSGNKNNLFLKLYYISIILNNLFGAAGHANRFILYFGIAICIAIPITIKNVIHHRYNLLYYTIPIFTYSVTMYFIKLSMNESNICPYYFEL